MNTPPNMVEHGIKTTKADYWVHFFPISRRAYWYRVDHVREYIRQENVPIKLGKSADKTPTGNGYLIPKTAYFVSNAEIPKKYVGDVDWTKLSDREKGFKGELIVAVLIEHKIVQFPPSRATACRTKEAQLASIDLSLQWMQERLIEIKTETHEGTDNLFVQSHEGGHRVHQIRGDEAGERFAEAPDFEEEIPF